MKKTTQGVTALLVAVLLFSLSASAALASRPGQEIAPLFTELPPTFVPQADRARPDLGEGRSRLAGINFASLEAAQVGARLPLNLFDDVQLTVVIQKVETQEDATVWTAAVEGSEFGQMFLVRRQGQIALDVSMPEGIYQVRYAGGDAHRVAQIDQSTYPEEMDPISVDLPAAPEPSGLAAPAVQEDITADSASAIDVLVAYTPKARTAAGGDTAIRNLITLAVAETNQSYLNSGVSQRLNLVNMLETNYAQSTAMDTDLSRAQNPSDGYMDELPQLRNQYGADLVSVIVESNEYCGIAYHMASLSSSFAANAYSVVARSCATGYYSFAHELGHNMGARHDYYVDNLTTPKTYAHGYVNLTGKWRTIMSYDSQCTAKGFSCTRLQFWANPDVTYGGAVMGVAGGTSTACVKSSTTQYTCDADDHRLLNETALTVANFRTHIELTPPPPFWQSAHYFMLPVIRK